MGIRIKLRDPVDPDRLNEDLQKFKIVLKPKQREFIARHRDHRGISIDGDGASCRTCNVSVR
jgi:hypothetical protein